MISRYSPVSAPGAEVHHDHGCAVDDGDVPGDGRASDLLADVSNMGVGFSAMTMPLGCIAGS